MIFTLLDFLALRRRGEFLECLDVVYDDFSEQDKQQLLYEIINQYYNHAGYEEFIKLFDSILRDSINLNFNINHRATTFLSLVIYRAPHLKLLNYFIKKGACVNFTGDTLAFVDEKDLEFAKMHLDGCRYQTCLDFAESELNDLISKDLHFECSTPKLRLNIDDGSENMNKLLINADEYAELQAQKLYLKRIILTKRIIDYLKCIGARNFNPVDRSSSN